MSKRAEWEKTLRRNLRKKRKRAWRVPVREWAYTGMFFAIAVALIKWLADLFGGVGIGLPCGAAGLLLGMAARGSFLSHDWVAFWAPVDHRAMRRIQMDSFGGIVWWSCLWVGGAVGLGACLLGPMSVLDAVGAAGVAMLTGFALAWGKVTINACWVGGAALGAAYFYDRVLGRSGGNSFEWALEWLPHVWLPSMPWSWFTMPVPYAGLQAVLIGGVIAFACRAFWKGWWEWNPLLVMEELEEEPGEPVEDEGEADVMSNIRKSVHHAWFGMAGYLPQTEARWFDQALWWWFAPRERWLSSIGSAGARMWFAESFRGIVCLIVMALLVLALPWEWVEVMIVKVPWLVFGTPVVLLAIAIVSMWPGRQSAFQSWLFGFFPEGLGVVPALSILPVTAREWMLAMWKEWMARSLWTGAWFGAMVALTLPLRVEVMAGSYWLGLVPIGFLLACFPISMFRRVFTAIAGGAFSDRALTRAFPALLFSLTCLFGFFVALGCGLFGAWAEVAISLAVAGCCGWAGVRCTLSRMHAPRLDQRPANAA